MTYNRHRENFMDIPVIPYDNPDALMNTILRLSLTVLLVAIIIYFTMT